MLDKLSKTGVFGLVQYIKHKSVWSNYRPRPEVNCISAGLDETAMLLLHCKCRLPGLSCAFH